MIEKKIILKVERLYIDRVNLWRSSWLLPRNSFSYQRANLGIKVIKFKIELLKAILKLFGEKV